MTFRSLDNRVVRLEADVPANRGERIDPATLTNKQLEMLEHAPRMANGELDLASMTTADLRMLASLLEVSV